MLMRSGKRLLWLSVCAIVAGVSLFLLYWQVAAPGKESERGSGSLDSSIANHPHGDEPLAKGAGIEIPLQRFLLYKWNVELAASLRPEEAPAALTDREIVEQLIATDLAVQYASAGGLKASEDEIEAAIEMERTALQDSDPDHEFARELMAERIQSTGLTEEAFWKDSEVRYYYEKAILLGKLGEKLAGEGKIASPTELSDFQRELFREQQSSITIDWSLVD